VYRINVCVSGTADSDTQFISVCVWCVCVCVVCVWGVCVCVWCVCGVWCVYVCVVCVCVCVVCVYVCVCGVCVCVNAGRSHSVKSDNSFFERMEMFKYLGTFLTN